MLCLFFSIPNPHILHCLQMLGRWLRECRRNNRNDCRAAIFQVPSPTFLILDSPAIRMYAQVTSPQVWSLYTPQVSTTRYLRKKLEHQDSPNPPIPKYRTLYGCENLFPVLTQIKDPLDTRCDFPNSPLWRNLDRGHL